MVIAEHIDSYGRGAWIALSVLGFILFWPLGLATLIFATSSGRLARHGYSRRWARHWASGGGCGFGGGWHDFKQRQRGHWHAASGNTAFDEYREETLRRLEEEQAEFVEYLDRLRAAKDKAEFDAFMEERRRAATSAHGAGGEG